MSILVMAVSFLVYAILGLAVLGVFAYGLGWCCARLLTAPSEG